MSCIVVQLSLLFYPLRRKFAWRRGGLRINRVLDANVRSPNRIPGPVSVAVYSVVV